MTTLWLWLRLWNDFLGEPSGGSRQRFVRVRQVGPSRRGAILTLFAILLPILLVIAGFSLYIANAQLVRTELRTATDFSARAAAKQMSLQQSEGAAIAGALDAASRNTIMGSPFELSASDVQVGQSRQLGGANSRFVFSADGNRKNSVRITGHSFGNRGMTQFFAGLTNIQEREFVLPATATNLDRDLCLVIDRSGSMTQPVDSRANGTLEPCGPLSSQSRFAALSRAVDAFIDELNATPQQEQVCLVSYSSRVNIPCFCCPTSSDPCPRVRARCRGRLRYRIRFNESTIHSQLSRNTGQLTGPIGSMLARGIGGATAIGSGLRSGIQAVEGNGARPFAFPTIVLMTDGNHNLGTDPRVVAETAADKEIVVHTLTFGAGADQGRMREVANLTGGKHIHADSEGDLAEAFREIARTLPVLLTD